MLRLIAQVVLVAVVAVVFLPFAIVLLGLEIVWGWANGKQQDT